MEEFDGASENIFNEVDNVTIRSVDAYLAFIKI